MELIFCGDATDRSPEPNGDRDVLELLRELQSNPGFYGLAGVTVLKGNHCDMLVKALAEESPGPAFDLWTWNGGDPDFLPIARDHQDWLAALPLMAIRNNYCFVHAGVRPGVLLNQQKTQDLLWIRRPFLDQDHGLPYRIVHGHTITPNYEVTVLPHRIAIDCGSFVSGRLATVEVDPWGHTPPIITYTESAR